MEVAIIGAGIGGLATALALKSAQIPFRIYEGAPALEPVGAGIMIANNAMQAFRNWGIAEAAVALGNRISVMNLTRPDLKPISSNDLGWFEERSGLHNIAIHRADLHRILVNAVGADHIVLNKRLKTISQTESAWELSFEDGTVAAADYLLGADGLRSRLRSALFGNGELRDAGQNCWRGVTDFELPERYHYQLNEAWGKREALRVRQAERPAGILVPAHRPGSGRHHIRYFPFFKRLSPAGGADHRGNAAFRVDRRTDFRPETDVGMEYGPRLPDRRRCPCHYS